MRWRRLIASFWTLVLSAIASATPPPAGPPADIQPDYPGADLLSADQLARFNKLLINAGSAHTAHAIAEGTRDWPVAPLLRNIAMDRDQPARERSLAMFWLGMTHDPRGVEVCVRVVDEMMSGESINARQLGLLRSAIIGMGFLGTEEAVDHVFEWLPLAYWLDRYDVPACPEKDFSPEQVAQYARRQALGALPYSGTLRAIHALASGEGIPEDLRFSGTYSLSTAIAVKAGIVGEPYDPNEIPVFKRLRRAAISESVQRKYGTLDEIRARLQSARAL